MTGALALCTLAGCATHPGASFAFLGIPENQASAQGPVGLINGQPCRINNVSAVTVTTYQEYLAAKQKGRVLTEKTHGRFVYYAIREQRDVRFDQASARVEVLERFKARKP